ncbi:glycoside hydrolase superfamily [Panaeolus papilionaceus]|nr:glycoside hydrolase superfamily [Panaeolus papilionaceus]
MPTIPPQQPTTSSSQPSSSSSAPPTPSPAPPILTTSGTFTCSTTHRTLLLRGVNLSGSSKAPLSYPSHILDDFWESAERGGESFIGQPLDVDDGSADVHLKRLKGWGFNLLRFPVSWESLERMGPKKYDYEYMDYIIRVLCKCREYGFKVYMDPHQDTWSRYSGGSGAPYWTLPACGINPSNITATQSSIIHSEYPLASTPDPSSLPAMIWSTNYGRLLCQTVFTLFFAGRDFAPKCVIDGVNIQDYLQGHFIEAFGALADRIREFEGGRLLDETVIGWDSLNEPYEGLCGWFDLNRNPTKQGSTLKKGTYPTPAQSFRMGMGQAQTVEHWSFGAMGPKRDGSVTIDPKGRKLWAEADDSPESIKSGEGEGSDGVHRKWGWKRDVAKWKLGTCPWAMHGVWDVDTGFVLEPMYFVTRPGTTQEVEFIADYWKPHFMAYTTRIRASHQNAILFVQPPVFARPPDIEESHLKGRAVYAPHYYDGFTLITKHWNWFNADALGMLRGKYKNVLASVKLGEGAIRKSFREQLGYLKEDALILSPDDEDDEGGQGEGEDGGGGVPMPRYPTVIGEIGTPFDMDNKKAYGYGNPKAKGDYTPQEKALDASLNAADGVNGLSWTVWTYVGVVGDADDGAHSHEWGDGWNGEDLSLWSVDDMVDEWGEWDLDGDVDEGDADVDAGRAKLVGAYDIDSSDDVDDVDTDTDNAARGGKAVGGGRRSRAVSRQPSAKSLMKVKPWGTATAGVGVNTGAGAGVSLNITNPGGRKSRSAAASEISLPTLGAGTSSSITAGSIRTKASAGSLRPILASSTGPGPGHSKTQPSTEPPSSLAPYKPTTPERLAGYSSNPLLFLTNGARAYRAFIRPYPMKTVGRVISVDFDIGKGSVRVVVGVGEGEIERRRREGRNGDAEDDATEIFVPLVHYAHPRLLEGLFDPSSSWTSSSSSTAKSSNEGHERITSTSTSTSTSTAASSTTLRNRKRAGAPDPIESYGGESGEEPVVDLDVWVSEGRWDVKGQVLRWWYVGDSTTSTSTARTSASGGARARGAAAGGYGKGGEVGERQYTIEIKRKGGALKGLPEKLRKRRRERERAAMMAEGGKGKGAGVREEEGGRSVCERLCPVEGCVVM